jgi:hypothetical protein
MGYVENSVDGVIQNKLYYYYYLTIFVESLPY